MRKVTGNARIAAIAGVALVAVGTLLFAPEESDEQVGARASQDTSIDMDRHRERSTPAAPSSTSSTSTVPPTTTSVSDTAVDPAGPVDAPARRAAPGPGIAASIAGQPSPGTPGSADPDVPIGDVAAAGHAPEGIGFASFPGASNAPAPTQHDGPSGYAVAPGCHTQCITSGLAFPRGFGAEMVIETSVPATVFVSVIADIDGDGAYEYGATTTGDDPSTEFRWALDHLAPGREHLVVVAATDEHEETAHAYGSFTTLSTRTAFVSVAGVDFAHAPANAELTELWARVDGGLDLVYANGFLAMSPAEHAHRHVELVFTARQRWGGGCATDPVAIASLPLAGVHHPSCSVWTSGWTDSFDLDTPPDLTSRWTTSEVPVRVESPVGQYGTFRLRADLVVHVAYS